jgi:hypothetical protein
MQIPDASNYHTVFYTLLLKDTVKSNHEHDLVIQTLLTTMSLKNELAALDFISNGVKCIYLIIKNGCYLIFKIIFLGI